MAPVGWWNNTKYLNKKELIPVPYTNMAAISLFWYTNMAAVTSDENDLYKEFWFVLCAPFPEQIFGNLQLIIKDLSSLILLAKIFEMLQLLFHVFNQRKT